MRSALLDTYNWIDGRSGRDPNTKRRVGDTSMRGLSPPAARPDHIRFATFRVRWNPSRTDLRFAKRASSPAVNRGEKLKRVVESSMFTMTSDNCPFSYCLRLTIAQSCVCTCDKIFH